MKAVSFRISCFLSEKYKVNAVLDICQKQHIINLAKIAKGADWNGGIILTQVNMLEAKTDLSKLVRMLETKEEDVIYLARNGTAQRRPRKPRRSWRVRSRQRHRNVRNIVMIMGGISLSMMLQEKW